jgi:hypothetical protein
MNMRINLILPLTFTIALSFFLGCDSKEKKEFNTLEKYNTEEFKARIKNTTPLPASKLLDPFMGSDRINGVSEASIICYVHKLNKFNTNLILIYNNKLYLKHDGHIATLLESDKEGLFENKEKGIRVEMTIDYAQPTRDPGEPGDDRYTYSSRYGNMVIKINGLHEEMKYESECSFKKNG